MSDLDLNKIRGDVDTATEAACDMPEYWKPLMDEALKLILRLVARIEELESVEIKEATDDDIRRWGNQQAFIPMGKIKVLPSAAFLRRGGWRDE